MKRLENPASERGLTRRQVLGASLASGAALLLLGCAGSSRSASVAVRPRWPDLEPLPPESAPDPAPYEPEATPPPDGHDRPLQLRVASRSAWSRGRPIPSRMNRLGAVERITVHHDGMPPALLRSRRQVAQRIELIRASHVDRGWGDIGYHYIVDPLGQVWEGRPIYFQGAHVHDHNERNLGVLALGNFETQQPTLAQVRTVARFVAEQMRRHRVSLSQVHTHRELTPTICPGRNMQRVMNRLRANGRLARA